MKNNDTQIELLQKKVETKEAELEQKKEKLGKTQTKLILHLEDQTYNLNVLNKDSLTLLLLKLSSLGTTLVHLEQAHEDVADLKLSETFLLDGYSLDAWVNDVLFKLKSIALKEEERQLKNIKKTLEDRLSEDRKIEKELNEIANILD